MMRLAAALLLLVPFSLCAKEWTVDPASTLSFSGTYQGEKFTGHFGRFTAAITFDPASLAAAKFDVSVDVTSITTGNADYDEQLKAPEFFDFGKFRQSRFVTTAFREGDNGLVADGTLTIRDKSRPTQLKVTFTPAGDGATLDVETTLKRLDFDVGTGDWADTSAIGNDVPVTAHLVLKPKG
ncbi:YceI family protein [Tahibacter amnicola]|uniref:YceI family protein n=1 Tax=Tahibacter amnicola TaxID=2976241 RepID=A0ABY6BL74_9GAMM|nr:YceI family protein [Tahibacter amnicola]UXI69326.1 YceI family protein [Tahibacter amnicola]